jgi:tRNA(Ile)-lysidine synthase
VEFDPKNLLNYLQARFRARRLLIAYSGGLDSTVLLHATMSLRTALAADIEAIHVHHGLRAEADDWVNHCRKTCTAWGVAGRIIHVDARPVPGHSPEATARAVRYEALKPLVSEGSCLLTAHHRDDQSETLLLQLLRGAGVAGLAAMPEVTRFGEGCHARPLLRYSRTALVEYAKRHQLEWLDDPSNQDIGFDRNFIRHKVMPLLRKRWPAASQTLTRAARLQAEALELITDLAKQDRRAVAGSRPHTLSVLALKKLSIPRQKNVLRNWICEQKLPLPTHAQLDRGREDILKAGEDRTPLVHWRGAEVRRYRDDLYAMSPLPPHNPHQEFIWRLARPLSIPHLGITINLQDLEAQGLVLPSSMSQVTVRFRVGGEQCRPRGESHHHALKKLYQQARVPPWQRDRTPLIYVEDKLVAVWGYWICE